MTLISSKLLWIKGLKLTVVCTDDIIDDPSTKYLFQFYLLYSVAISLLS